MVCMVDLGATFLVSLFTLVSHVLCCCLHFTLQYSGPNLDIYHVLSGPSLDKIYYTCIVLLLSSFTTPHYMSRGPSADLFTKSVMGVIWQHGKLNSLLN